MLDPPEKNIPLINAFKPDVIHSYGSYLEVLFARLLATGEAFHRPKAVGFGGDGLSDSARKLIMDHFGIPAFSVYSSVEAPSIAFECGEHRGLHINEDIYPLRIVDASGRSLPPGEYGEVVVSNLVNRTMVLLNYRLGDLATLLPDPCPCGRSLRLMSFPEGRKDDWLELPTGEPVHPSLVYPLLRDEEGVLQYQLVQETPSDFHVSLVAKASCNRPETEARLAAKFGRVFGEKTRLRCFICFFHTTDFIGQGATRRIHETKSVMPKARFSPDEEISVKFGLSLRGYDLGELLTTRRGWSLIAVALLYRSGRRFFLAARWYRRHVVRSTRLVAVVGSLGKSTTTRMVTAALGGDPSRATERNGGIFLAWRIFQIRRGDPYAVIEVGISRPGQMRTYANFLCPDVAVVTMVGSEHNRSLGSLEATREQKSEMVRALPASGLAVLNGDDPHVRRMARVTRARVVTFGLEAGRDVFASDIALDWPGGTSFAIHLNGAHHQARTRLIGRHMIYPLLAAAAVATEEKIPLAEILERLKMVEPAPGRLQPVRLMNGAILLRDESKSTLESVEAALRTLGEIQALPAHRRHRRNHRSSGECVSSLQTARPALRGDMRQGHLCGLEPQIQGDLHRRQAERLFLAILFLCGSRRPDRFGTPSCRPPGRGCRSDQGKGKPKNGKNRSRLARTPSPMPQARMQI